MRQQDVHMWIHVCSWQIHRFACVKTIQTTACVKDGKMVSPPAICTTSLRSSIPRRFGWSTLGWRVTAGATIKQMCKVGNGGSLKWVPHIQTHPDFLFIFLPVVSKCLELLYLLMEREAWSPKQACCPDDSLQHRSFLAGVEQNNPTFYSPWRSSLKPGHQFLVFESVVFL